MVRLEVDADVPESRQVTVTLPPGVPTGRVRLTVVVGVEPPGPPAYRPDDSALVAEHAAFYRLLPELVRTHLGRYVAVHGGRVVAAGPHPHAVEAEARAVLGDVPAFVGLVAEPPPPGVVHSGVVRIVDNGGGG